MRVLFMLLILLIMVIFSGCGTTDSTLREAGHSEAYVQGFHDGRHSGMREAGNQFEHYIRDDERYEADTEYRSGWIAGEQEGQHLQAQAVAAGRVAGDVYQGLEIGREVDKQTDFDGIAKDAVKGVDTSDLKGLEQ